MSAPRVFDLRHYELLNRARGDVVVRLLTELRPKLGLRTAVDVGCGVGHFSGLLQSQGLETTGVDGRKENSEEAARRNQGIPFHTINAEDSQLVSLGRFDLVFCFGLLYHLENPLRAIRHLSAMTNNLLLIEAVIFPGDEPGMVLIDEFELDDQGLEHIAFYPTESCLVKMLYRAGFLRVYGLKKQPDHPEYHQSPASRRVRTMLAASCGPLDCAQLVEIKEPRSAVTPWDSAVTGEPSGEMLKLGRVASKPVIDRVAAIKRFIGKR